MKLFVWDDAFDTHIGSLAVVLANDKEEAREILSEALIKDGRKNLVDDVYREEPTVHSASKPGVIYVLGS
jgi:hypothetical protein